jgi:hypothetical protein
VLAEINQRGGTPTADHLRTVLNAIGEPSTDMNSTMLGPKRQPNSWTGDALDGSHVLVHRSVGTQQQKCTPNENAPANNSASHISPACVNDPKAFVANTTAIPKQRRSMLRDWFAPSWSRFLR